MHLSPADTEKLLLSVAGMVARDRLERGVRLNHPETVALLSTWVIERAREGAGVAELMEAGRTVLTADQVMEGVPEMLHDVQVEATFPDGRKLVTLHHPVGPAGAGVAPGAVRTGDGTVVLNERPDGERIELVVENTGDRPVQIGSHVHLPDANAALAFDRAAAHGHRLDIPSGTSQRFEPGVSRRVAAVALRGARRVPGLQVKSEQEARSMAELTRARVRRPLRPDRGRPGPARRHRPVDAGRAGPHRRRRGGRLRRRQVDPRVDGPVRPPGPAGVLGHRHHQRARPRPLGRRQRRRRHPRRPDRRAGTGRQPRHRRRRAPRPADRAVHRRHQRRGAHPHGGRHRRPRAPAVRLAGARGARHRDDHPRRRRHRAVGGFQGDDGDAGRVAPGRRAPRAGRVPGQRPAARQGQHGRASKGCASRRLGGAAGYKVHEDWGSTPAAIDAALRAADEWGLQVALHSRLAQRGGLPRVDAAGDRRPLASTPSTPRAPAAGTRRTS